jgi:hypothetical protein
MMILSIKRVLLPVILLFTTLSILFLYKNTTPAFPSSSQKSGLKADSSRFSIANTANVEQIEFTKKQWENCLDPHAEPTEYLSIVIVTRVDDYAG